jgi:electron transfer flavoprotein alpha subunit
MSAKELWVLAEMGDAGPKRVSYELMSKASEIAAGGDFVPVAVVLGGDDSAAKSMARYGARKVYLCQDERFATYHATPIADTLSALIGTRSPVAVFLPATTLGKDIIGRVAATLRLGMLADCVAVASKDGVLTATEANFGGSLLTECVCSGPGAHLLSFRPNTFAAVERPGEAQLERVPLAFNEATAVRVVQRSQVAAGAVGLEEASVVIAGGRGMGAPDKFALLEELARVLGGAVGASRAAVDAGWRPYAEQVGQTGKTVKPSVYIACGISGAIQHKIGMQTAEHIIAINKDADAPIFSFADMGVVGDVFAIVPLLIAEIKKRKGG